MRLGWGWGVNDPNIVLYPPLRYSMSAIMLMQKESNPWSRPCIPTKPDCSERIPEKWNSPATPPSGRLRHYPVEIRNQDCAGEQGMCSRNPQSRLCRGTGNVQYGTSRPRNTLSTGNIIDSGSRLWKSVVDQVSILNRGVTLAIDPICLAEMTVNHKSIEHAQKRRSELLHYSDVPSPQPYSGPLHFIHICISFHKDYAQPLCATNVAY